MEEFLGRRPPRGEDAPELEGALGEPQDEGPDEIELPEPGWHGRKALVGWLVSVAVLVIAGVGVIFAGQRLYQPASRIPALTETSMQPGLLGTTGPTLRELDATLALLNTSGLTLSGAVYELPFPRTLADRLFGKRRERATIFAARTGEGAELRFLVLRDGSRTLYAIEPPGLRRASEPAEGWFLAMPVSTATGDPRLAAQQTNLAEALQAADRAGATELSPARITIFGPFDTGDQGRLQSRIESNAVLTHLAGALRTANADVGVSAPLFLLRGAPERGRIRGLYQPQLRVILAPLWGTADDAVLAHELTHAYIARVVRDETVTLQSAAGYFDRTHPRLYREVIGDLYEGLDSLGRAEEALAFMTGSVAAGDTKTNTPALLLENQALLSVTEAILKSDIELLIDIGLVPACMDPRTLRYEAVEISFAFYKTAQTACSSSRAADWPATEVLRASNDLDWFGAVFKRAVDQWRCGFMLGALDPACPAALPDTKVHVPAHIPDVQLHTEADSGATQAYFDRPDGFFSF